ncbi:uncharacterized protein At4g04775-like [Brassica napus]|uniref:uncharacterized protein At4g04775-like n=1 Tax=Brassica napus TaxID=3708 RepID=UPI00207AB7E5|nr:uncharacterized protein At4g04775-like [Brassica napus]
MCELVLNPQTCYCGAPPMVATSNSRNDPGRRYYTCTNVDDGECHVWKWWDVAVMEEMRAKDRHVLQLAEKVDSLTLLSDYETEQKLVRLEKIVSDIAKEKSKFTSGFEYFLGVMVIAYVIKAYGIKAVGIKAVVMNFFLMIKAVVMYV